MTTIIMRLFRRFVLSLAISFAISISSFSIAGSGTALFSFSDTLDGAGSFRTQSTQLGLRVIIINRDVGNARKGEALLFPLPSGRVISIVVEERNVDNNGDTVLQGRFDDNGIATITFGKNSTFANVQSSNEHYAISVNANGESTLINFAETGYDIDQSKTDFLVPPGFKPMAHEREVELGRFVQPQSVSEKSQVTILAIYSAEFATGFNNDPVTRINQMITFTNSAFDRSGINIELVLVHARQINFDNSASDTSILLEATGGENDFGAVSQIRDEYGADLVAVLAFNGESFSSSGLAWVSGNNADFAYSLSRYSVLGLDSLFAHELGHNLGSEHERVSANPLQIDPCEGGYTTYSCGHGNGNQGTIMSYLDSSGVWSLFSNPMLDCGGEPCGIAAEEVEAADNKISFNITGPLVANFRLGPIVNEESPLCVPIKSSNNKVSMVCL